MDSETCETVVRTVIQRCEAPVVAYFGGPGPAGLFFAWLATLSPIGGRLARGESLREALRELLREHAGTVRPEAEAAFDAAWRVSAVDAVRDRFRAERRIVPFLAYERVAAGEAAEEVAARLGLDPKDVRGYVEEVERELRRERLD
jgi:hypothetical protein